MSNIVKFIEDYIQNVIDNDSKLTPSGYKRLVRLDIEMSVRNEEEFNVDIPVEYSGNDLNNILDDAIAKLGTENEKSGLFHAEFRDTVGGDSLDASYLFLRKGCGDDPSFSKPLQDIEPLILLEFSKKFFKGMYRLGDAYTYNSNLYLAIDFNTMGTRYDVHSRQFRIATPEMITWFRANGFILEGIKGTGVL